MGVLWFPPLAIWPFVPGAEIRGTQAHFDACAIYTLGVIQTPASA